MLITFFQLSKRMKVTFEKTPDEKRRLSKDADKVNYEYVYLKFFPSRYNNCIQI